MNNTPDSQQLLISFAAMDTELRSWTAALFVAALGFSACGGNPGRAVSARVEVRRTGSISKAPPAQVPGATVANLQRPGRPQRAPSSPIATVILTTDDQAVLLAQQSF